ncbi:GTP-binding protein 1-like [Teleopsis dalmanni]|uniref:GTP-binding protein 1-like n=1 Tax=Teleopsis dalmanni TaxID=139649 RepID=UPI0018CE5C6E|nr:GTP-binding protein 1-like [Teleopsis dalmanni]XP_037948181.1 GTP-binding protein 1-like [Teleopsis dalmanni]XP_037948182.1 GTP-binding protein 1-like [Teleopsis dalmanni]XP_037948184.1 GTP-binding protein 1-like [Teleopsis dalmanni]XP_037948185.1 GTP-binding protein 1-like [Teleopsis dalmanni]
MSNEGALGSPNGFMAPNAMFEDMHSPKTDYSSIRGKVVLVSPTEEQYELLKKRLEERTFDSGGETIYEIGVGEDGSDSGLVEDEYQASVATLQSLATTIDADMVLLRQRKGEMGITGQYLIRKRVDTSDFMEIRVAVVGNVDAGKSTLLGVLTHGELDNGRGHARQRLFRHKHEMESGRTSSVGNDILGFDSIGNVVNKPDHGTLDWVKICEKSAKVITFIDLAGHERYLKTTVFGMTGHAPDFGMLMIGANAGIVGMTKEHLGLALALSVPVFVVVTKIDMCPPNVLQDNLKLLFKILKSQGCRKVPVMVKTPDEVVLSATNFVSERLCPIFQVSNVTGENLNLLKMFLNLLTARMSGQGDQPAEFQIDDTYSVPGVGTVVSGTCLQGLIKLNDILMLGPDPLGNFTPIAVKSIHRKRMNVKEVRGGQTASFALKKIKRSQIRKGMVMVSPELKPQACWEFEGEILVLHHPTTISSRYQAMVHCGSIRQTASIVNMSKECLRTGDKAHVKFRFIKHPEYIRPGQRMVFREGRTKAVGNVLKPITNSVAIHHRAKPNKMQSRGTGQGSSHSQNQNQSPNVQAATAKQVSTTPAEGVLEASVDKRDNRSGKRTKRNYSHNTNGAAGNTSTANPAGTAGNIKNDQPQANSSHISKAQ